MLPRSFFFRSALLATLAFSVAGCNVVPSGGPTSGELLRSVNEDNASEGYAIFDLTSEVARLVAPSGGDSFRGRFGSRGPRSTPVVGAGDILAVSVFESSLGGLFTPPETSTGSTSKSVTLPPVTVDPAGNIRIPFAGSIRAAGRTPAQIERAIEDQLKGRAIDPQVVVTLGTNRSSMVTVSGDVRSANRFPIGFANERLLDVISQAGGAQGAAHETMVKVVRGSTSATVSLKAIQDNPNENIYIRPGDTVVLERQPRSVVALGASGRNAEVRFESDRMTLSTALASAGGLLDYRADPTGVFVFRMESIETIRRLRPEYVDPQHRSMVPTVYKLDLKTAEGYFVAQSFQMRNRDQLFIANADGAQLLKFLQLIGTTVGTSASVASASR